jgi:hypothetical protein
VPAPTRPAADTRAGTDSLERVSQHNRAAEVRRGSLVEVPLPDEWPLPGAAGMTLAEQYLPVTHDEGAARCAMRWQRKIDDLGAA